MTVRKRKDTGKWISDISHNGERIVTTLKLVSTRKQAEQAEAVIMTGLFKRAYGLEPKPDVLFENFVIETFLPYSEANKKSFVSDVSVCRTLARHFKGRSIRQLTPSAIEAFKQWFLAKPIVQGPPGARTQRKRSLATVNNHLRVLSKILSLAVDADLIESNPCFRVRKFKPNNQRLRVLSFEEEERLLRGFVDVDFLKHIVLVALHTGMRRGEIFDLQWQDLDFPRSRLLVRKSKSSIERYIPMNATMKKLLHPLCRTDGYVFPSPRTGGRLLDVKKSFRKAVEGAGLDNFRFHDLRHTFATRLADNGVDAFVLKELLGHADIRTTVRYTHAASAAMHVAVEKLNAKEHFCDGSATATKMAGETLP